MGNSRAWLAAIAVSAVITSGTPAVAHHSNPRYFDMTKAITLEGVVLSVRWINPHVILYLQSKNANGEPETWVIHGRSLNNAMRQEGLKDRLQPGISITARAWPSRIPLFVNDEETVLHTGPDDTRQSSRIVGGGQVKLANGDVLAFGGGPTF